MRRGNNASSEQVAGGAEILQLDGRMQLLVIGDNDTTDVQRLRNKVLADGNRYLGILTNFTSFVAFVSRYIRKRKLAVVRPVGDRPEESWGAAVCGVV